MSGSIALAIGQIEEAMGLIDGRTVDSDRMLHAYEALVRARDFLLAEPVLEPPEPSLAPYSVLARSSTAE